MKRFWSGFLSLLLATIVLVGCSTFSYKTRTLWGGISTTLPSGEALAVKVDSVEELSSYRQDEREWYDANASAFSVYTDEFFEDHTLVLVFLEETSGSNHVGISSVDKRITGIEVILLRQEPPIGTDDMRGWSFLIEIDKLGETDTVFCTIRTQKLIF